MPFVQSLDRVKLHYEVHDYTDPWREPETLFLQHGYGRSSQFWYALIPHLARTFRVVCPDLRGLGQSSSDFDLETKLTPDHLIADAIAIADELGAKTFHFAGESMGGVIGFYVAAAHPDRIRTLSVMSSPLQPNRDVHGVFTFGYPSRDEALRDMGSEGWARAVNTATRFPPDTDPKLMDWYATEMGKSPVESLVAYTRITSGADAVPLLSKFDAPILAIYPSDGKIASRQQVKLLIKHRPDARVVHLPNPHHTIWALAPGECARHILYFAATADGYAVTD